MYLYFIFIITGCIFLKSTGQCPRWHKAPSRYSAVEPKDFRLIDLYQKEDISDFNSLYIISG